MKDILVEMRTKAKKTSVKKTESLPSQEPSISATSGESEEASTDTTGSEEDDTETSE
jgi:hypothetical protein